MQTEYPERYRVMGLKIAYYRKRAGYTQEAFAEKNRAKHKFFRTGGRPWNDLRDFAGNTI